MAPVWSTGGQTNRCACGTGGAGRWAESQKRLPPAPPPPCRPEYAKASFGEPLSPGTGLSHRQGEREQHVPFGRGLPFDELDE